MAADNDRLIALAASVSDGKDVDWDVEESGSTDGDEKAVLRSLRLVDLVSRMQRTARPGEASTAARPIDRWGAIEILERVGGGGYGDVHRAWDPRLQREIALKILKARPDRSSSAEIHRILAEGRRLSSVRHPNVVTIHGVDEVDGRPAIAMEFVRGCTLADIVREHGPFGPEEIVGIGLQTCRALAAVHAAGIVHQDLKAQNVMREDGGRIVLMDFGLGGGTALASAPEVLQGGEPSVASDIYGLGVLLFHLATGTYPVIGRSLEELREAHAAGRSTRLRDARADLPPSLVATIERALARDPALRFRSAGEMENALAGHWGTVEAAPRRRGRSVTIATIAGLGLAVAAVLIWWAASKRDHAPAEVHPSESVASVPTATTPITGSFDVEASVYRGREQRDRLAAGAIVALGDSISLTIQASQSLYVYVLNEDDRGNSYLLFPAAETLPQNPLPPGTRHVLPGTRRGSPAYWQITTEGGREHLLLLGSRTRLVDLESDLLLVERPREGAPVEAPHLSAETKTHLRGMGGFVTDATQQASAEQSLFDSAQPLATGRESVDGLWARRIDFESRAR